MAAEEQTGRITPYILRETIVSAAINGVIGALFFFAVFGAAGRVTVAGWGGYATDFLPQSGAVALMACLVPAMIARRAQRTGRLATGSEGLLAMPWLLRAALVALLFGLLLGAAIAHLWLRSGMATLDWPPALIIQMFYGAALGAIVTFRVLRRTVGGTALI